MARQVKILNVRGFTVITDDESPYYLGLLDSEFKLGVGDGTFKAMLASQELTEKGQVHFPRTNMTVSLVPPLATSQQVEGLIGEFRDVIEGRTETLDLEITMLANLAGALMENVSVEVAKACCMAVLHEAETDGTLEPEDGSEC